MKINSRLNVAEENIWESEDIKETICNEMMKDKII